jgi:hypothetical protein
MSRSEAPVDLLASTGVVGPGRPIFIGGCSRSGTTLLGAMLGVGPRLLTVPEAEFKWQLCTAASTSDSPISGVLDTAAARRHLENDRMLRLWAVDLPADLPAQVTYSSFLGYLVVAFGRASGKPDADVWIDHTPGNIRFVQTLRRAFPDARFVNIIRDGRAVTASVLPLDWGANDVFESAYHWSAQVAAGLAAAAQFGPEVVHTVQYEDLIKDPTTVLTGICEFAGIDFDEAMVGSRDYRLRGYEHGQQDLVLQTPDVSRIDGWRQQLSPHQIRDFEWVTGELLGYLGYELVYGVRARRRSKREHLTAATVSTARRLVINKVSFRRRQKRALQADTYE